MRDWGVDLVYQGFVVGRCFPPAHFVRCNGFCSVAGDNATVCGSGVGVLGGYVVSSFVIHGMILSIFGATIVSCYCIVRNSVP